MYNVFVLLVLVSWRLYPKTCSSMWIKYDIFEANPHLQLNKQKTCLIFCTHPVVLMKYPIIRTWTMFQGSCHWRWRPWRSTATSKLAFMVWIRTRRHVPHSTNCFMWNPCPPMGRHSIWIKSFHLTALSCPIHSIPVICPIQALSRRVERAITMNWFTHLPSLWRRDVCSSLSSLKCINVPCPPGMGLSAPEEAHRVQICVSIEASHWWITTRHTCNFHWIKGSAEVPKEIGLSLLNVMTGAIMVPTPKGDNASPRL